MIRRLASLAVLAALAATPAHAADTCQANESAMEPLYLKALEAELMVSELICNHGEANLAAFKERFAADIASNDAALESWFRKNYGSAWESRMNAFLTGLANRAAQMSAKDDWSFCTNQAALADQLWMLEDGQLIDFTKQHVRLVPAGQNCLGKG